MKETFCSFDGATLPSITVVYVLLLYAAVQMLKKRISLGLSIGNGLLASLLSTYLTCFFSGADLRNLLPARRLMVEAAHNPGARREVELYYRNDLHSLVW